MDEEGIGEGGTSVTSARLVQDALKTRWRETPSPASSHSQLVDNNVLSYHLIQVHKVLQIEKVLSGVEVNVERSDYTQLSPSRPEFVYCLKPTITHHFLDLNCT